MSERKSLSYLIEAEMDKATVLMASKGITDRLQQMAEQVAMMVAKDVMPLGDTMRDVFGVEASKAFQSAISEKLNSLVSTIGDVKDSINDQIDTLENGGSASDLASAESTDDLFGDDPNAPGADAEPTDDDFASDVGVEERGKKDDLSDLDDVFADSPETGTGRGMKEGATPRKRALKEGAEKFKVAIGASDHTDGKIVATEDSLPAAKKAAADYMDGDEDLEDSVHILSGDKAWQYDPMADSWRKCVMESADRRVAREFSTYLREGKDVARAARLIAETYNIDLSTVAEIVSKVNKAK